MQAIIGIDPGSRITGVGVIQRDKQIITPIYAESVRLPSALSLADRLPVLYARIEEIIQQTKPQVAVIEKVFLAKNPQSVLTLGQARGVCLLCAAHYQLPVVEYSATQIKKAVVGKGHADKTQVQHMVRVLLQLKNTVSEDASDALAAAICYAYSPNVASSE